MAVLDQLNHLLNFLAPALAVGVLLALVAPLFYKKRPKAPVLYAQAAINVVACSVVLFLGLWYFGNDGKMATYGVMLVVCATIEFAFLQS